MQQSCSIKAKETCSLHVKNYFHFHLIRWEFYNHFSTEHQRLNQWCVNMALDSNPDPRLFELDSDSDMKGPQRPGWILINPDPDSMCQIVFRVPSFFRFQFFLFQLAKYCNLNILDLCKYYHSLGHGRLIFSIADLWRAIFCSRSVGKLKIKKIWLAKLFFISLKCWVSRLAKKEFHKFIFLWVQ